MEVQEQRVHQDACPIDLSGLAVSQEALAAVHFEQLFEKHFNSIRCLLERPVFKDDISICEDRIVTLRDGRQALLRYRRFGDPSRSRSVRLYGDVAFDPSGVSGFFDATLVWEGSVFTGRGRCYVRHPGIGLGSHLVRAAAAAIRDVAVDTACPVHYYIRDARSEREHSFRELRRERECHAEAAIAGAWSKLFGKDGLFEREAGGHPLVLVFR